MKYEEEIERTDKGSALVNLLPILFLFSLRMFFCIFIYTQKDTMQASNTFVLKSCSLLQNDFLPVVPATLPKGLTFFTTNQLIKRFKNFAPEGSLTEQELFDALIDRGFDVMEIKPFGYVWLMQDKKIKF